MLSVYQELHKPFKRILHLILTTSLLLLLFPGECVWTQSKALLLIFWGFLSSQSYCLLFFFNARDVCI